MGRQSRCLILLLIIQASFELIACTGICKFATMFPIRISTDEPSIENSDTVEEVLQCTNNTLEDSCACNKTEIHVPRSCYCLHDLPPVRKCRWFPNDCYQLLKGGITESGIYTIQIFDYLRINVSCDMTTDGGGWTILQRRSNGSLQFDRRWEDYKEGFGLPYLDFWLGNENIHHLTTEKQTTLRIDMVSFNATPFYATYDKFAVGSEIEKYRLESLGDFGGTTDLVNAMACHETMYFSTRDRDYDRNTKNCANITGAGWWFNGGGVWFHAGVECPNRDCKNVNLNGVYGTKDFQIGILWDTIYGLKFTEMKIRPYIHQV